MQVKNRFFLIFLGTFSCISKNHKANWLAYLRLLELITTDKSWKLLFNEYPPGRWKKSVKIFAVIPFILCWKKSSQTDILSMFLVCGR
jgi:hypothetical protein